MANALPIPAVLLRLLAPFLLLLLLLPFMLLLVAACIDIAAATTALAVYSISLVL